MQDGTKAGLLFASEGAFFVIAAVGGGGAACGCGPRRSRGGRAKHGTPPPPGSFFNKFHAAHRPKIKNCVTLSPQFYSPT